jgi:hypothetical protein
MSTISPSSAADLLARLKKTGDNTISSGGGRGGGGGGGGKKKQKRRHNKKLSSNPTVASKQQKKAVHPATAASAAATVRGGVGGVGVGDTAVRANDATAAPAKVDHTDKATTEAAAATVSSVIDIASLPERGAAMRAGSTFRVTAYSTGCNYR